MRFSEELARALFLLAFIEVRGVYRLENQYWPNTPEYDDDRRASPWFLVKTDAGLVKIGWRKRVISIDWSDTKITAMVTEDEVTKEPHLVHAWSYANAVKYLYELGKAFKTNSGEANASIQNKASA